MPHPLTTDVWPRSGSSLAKLGLPSELQGSVAKSAAPPFSTFSGVIIGKHPFVGKKHVAKS